MSMSKIIETYVQTREPFVQKGIRISVDWLGNHIGYRAVCYSARESNREGTNGIRLGEHVVSPGFYAFMSEPELSTLTDILKEESLASGIQFILDEELTKEEGYRALYFYKMELLKAKLV